MRITFKNTCPLLAVIIVFAGYYFILLNTYPLMADDYGYSTLASLSSPLSAQKLLLIWHLFKNMFSDTWNPRVGQMIIHILSNFPKIYSSIILTITAIGFNLLIFFYVFLRLPSIKNISAAFKDALGLVFIFILQIIITPYIGNAILWKSGSFNHFFGQVLLLLVFTPYYLLFHNKQGLSNNPITIILYAIACFLAAFNTETVVPIVIMLMGIAIIYTFIKHKKLSWWCIFGFISICLGFARVVYLYFFTNSRLKLTAGQHHKNNINYIISNLHKLSKGFSYTFHEYTLWFYLSLIVMLFCLFKIIKKIKNQGPSDSYNELIVKTLLYCSVLIFSLMFLAIDGARQPRVIHFQTFLIICIIMLFLRYLIQASNFFQRKYIAYSMYIILGIFLIFSIVRMLNIYRVIANFSQQISGRNASILIESKKLPKNATIAVPIPKVMYNYKILKLNISGKGYDEWVLNGIRNYYNIPQKLINEESFNIN